MALSGELAAAAAGPESRRQSEELPDFRGKTCFVITPYGRRDKSGPAIRPLRSDRTA